ncbi:hypothetical protein [Ralstonia sp. ASV6]|uniref:hypothetical protein n=1 Tax=Ralstonia sp. ASV6 TaxID=2795124 RepID=UPI0018EAB51F|nr:hypothetical protein [Ralstonia sp. ASV6]
MSEMTPEAEIVIRRFKDRKLAGSDLQLIRTDVVRLTQEQLSEEWGISRTLISRIESSPEPDQRQCDQYLGLLTRRFFFPQAG